MDDQVCADFFQSGAVQLADRAEKNRTMLDDAQVSDPASYGEVSLLSQRITDLVEDASADQAGLLERVNAPFVQVRDAVLDDPDQTVSDAEITVPEVDTTDSAPRRRSSSPPAPPDPTTSRPRVLASRGAGEDRAARRHTCVFRPARLGRCRGWRVA
ncbi:hypothetical protein [Ornithinimicrobium sp. W1665]|uniref:hypothetical protein n=1 Tax=Ornithinimicrobium sp. W1665 TaxID=3416666 RepID=UPI003D6BAF22